MKTLRTVHLYLGLVVAIPLLLILASGIGLVFKESIWRLQYPELAESVPALSADDHGAALEAIQKSFEPEVTLVKWPQPDLAAYQVWLADGSAAFIKPLGHEIIARWHWYEDPMAFLAELHIHLLAGDIGKSLAGYLGLCLLALIVTGAIVWWPRRRGFLWSTLKLSSLGRLQLLAFHRNLGILMTPVAIVIITAGIGVAFFQPARILLNGLFGDDAGEPLSRPPAVEIDSSRRASMTSLVERAEAVFPEASLVFFYPEKEESGIVTVRKRMPEEMHPNGLSFVYLDAADGRILKVIDASAAQPGDRIANKLYPIHAAKWGGIPYKVVVILNGLLLVSMLLSGSVAYFRRST